MSSASMCRKCSATAVAFGSSNSDTPARAPSPSIDVSEQKPDTVATSIAVSPRAEYMRSRTAAPVNPASVRLWPNAYAMKAVNNARVYATCFCA